MLPIPDAVRGASEILGLDPLHIANEGLVLVILPDEKTEQALAVMQNYPEGKNAAVIGCIQEKGDRNSSVLFCEWELIRFSLWM